MSKLQDATRQVDAATRELKREQDEWRTKLADLQRQSLKYTTGNRLLEKKNIALTEQSQKLTKQIEDSSEKIQSLTDQYDDLEEKVTQKGLELADLYALVERRKNTINAELDAYAIERKKQIKDDILAVNQELLDKKADLARITEDADTVRAELAG